MNKPIAKQKRKRGLYLTPEGMQKLQAAKIACENQQNRGNRFSIQDISERVGVNTATVSKVLSGDEAVDKRTLELFFNAFGLELDRGCYTSADQSQRQDWGEAISVSTFYGRTEELTTLEQWLLQHRCRIVAILGMGGVGKTALSVKLAHQIKQHYEYVIWRSLREAPPATELLANLLQFVSDERETQANLPQTTGERISRLIEYLREHRCLLILDNLESILQSGNRAGVYRTGYQEYGELIRRVGETEHQSSLLLTSREKPHQVAILEGETLDVRSLTLNGLNSDSGKEILKMKGLCAQELQLQKLVERYEGNALALKVVATTIRDLFSGDVGEFLQEETTVFGDISELLEQQFVRLSELEKDIMYWLAINREPVSLSQLKQDIVTSITPKKILEAVESLARRSLVEESESCFTQQAVVMEYVTNRLIEHVCQEIESQKLELFRCHALMKATAKDYIRESQIRLIVKPIINGLLTVLRSKTAVVTQLTQMLTTLRQTSPQEQSYTAGNIFNLLRHLGTDLSGYDFSHLTVWQADLRRVKLHNTSFQNANLAKCVFVETFGGVLSVAFSPNGKLVATGDINGEIRLYQVGDWTQLLTCRGHTDWVVSLTFSPDSCILASSSEDQTIRFWNVTTGECLQILQEHRKGVWSIAFNSGGQILGSGDDDNTIKIWDVSTGKCLKTWRGHHNMVQQVIFSPDSKVLISASVDKTLKLWDVHTGDCLKTFQGHDEAIWSATLSPDGCTLASASSDQTVKLWNIKTGQCLMILQGHSGWLSSVAFNPNGQILASGSWDQTVKLWNISTGECLKTLPGHNHLVRKVAFSPNGQMLVSVSDDQSLRIWDVSTGQCLRTLQGYSDRIWSIALSPNGQMLASGGDRKIVDLWNIQNSQCLGTFTGHENVIRSVTFSLDGRILASSSDDRTIRLWDIHNHNCYRTLKGHKSWVWSIAWSPNDQILVSGSHDQTIKFWDVSNGECLETVHAENHGVLSVTFSPDGQRLASGSHDHSVKLWDISNSMCIKTLIGHTSWVWSVAFSPDGQILASGSHDYTVKLWDVKTGQCIKTLRGHTGAVRSVAFSGDGQLLSSGSMDLTMKLWEVSSGKCLKTLQQHHKGILSVTFNSQDRTLMSGGEDETIRIWDLETGECIKSLLSKKPYEGMNLTGVVGLTEAMITSLKKLGAIEYKLEVPNNKK